MQHQLSADGRQEGFLQLVERRAASTTTFFQRAGSAASSDSFLDDDIGPNLANTTAGPYLSPLTVMSPLNSANQSSLNSPHSIYIPSSPSNNAGRGGQSLFFPAGRSFNAQYNGVSDSVPSRGWLDWLHCPPLPDISGNRVLRIHLWASVKYWFCGAAKLNYRLVVLIILAIVVFLSCIISYSSMNMTENTDNRSGSWLRLPLSQTAPPTLKPPLLPNTSDPEHAILHLAFGSALTDPLVNVSSDTWASNRCYAVVIDAGSSGSRVLIYSWKDPRLPSKKNIITIEKGSELGPLPQLKTSPGISSFAKHPQKVANHIRSLLDFAASVVPIDKHKSTPIFLFATAGMRLLSSQDQQLLLKISCTYARLHYNFLLPESCISYFQVISGELEGIFGWLTVNYLKGTFDSKPDLNPVAGHDSNAVSTAKHIKPLFGFLDMGGASAQIAFSPTAYMAKEHSDDLKTVQIRFLDGLETTYSLFVSTFLGFGVNEARKRYEESFIKPSETTTESLKTAYRKQSTAPTSAYDLSHTNIENFKIHARNMLNKRDELVFDDPCLPLGLKVSSSHSTDLSTIFNGSGSYDDCMARIHPLLNKDIQCAELPCLFNGVHAPIADFRNHHFIGVSEFWYTLFDVYELGGEYDYQRLLDASRSYCSTSWKTILAKHEQTPYPNVEDMDRLQFQCFKSAWIMSVLHDGLGLPKIIPGNTDTTGESDQANHFPVFQSINEIDDFPISWTLGAVLLYASSTIQPNTTRHSTSLAFTVTGTRFTDFIPWYFVLIVMAVFSFCIALLLCSQYLHETRLLFFSWFGIKYKSDQYGIVHDDF
ncbi:Golgi apyrase [Batrachochytrium dendrobatidis]|nr:Golgi apyrase [Batrachochytrium dendrobatidis]KAK5665166.1 Golgi apyrase [Batrachochytrium dendrobatidis]